MKRMISIALSLVMLIMAIVPSCAFAEGTLIKTYDSITITISPNDIGNEKEFREFVKTVSETYYSTYYDYNKYYYLASDVKIDWDDGGFFNSRRSDAYSTYDKDSEYNIQQIQAMLIDGIQQKADTISVSLDDYVEGMALNPISGAWEINGRAVISQQQYNADLDAAIEQAGQSLCTTLVNSTADIALIYFGKGKVPDSAYDVVNVITTVIEDGMNAYSKALHDNVTAVLQNNYRALMTQAVLDMYDNIDEQMSADYRSMYAELKNKSNLTEDERLLRDELQKLINSLDKAKKSLPNATPEEVDQVCLEAAETLVEEIGLELHPYLSDQEIVLFVVEEVTTSIILNTLDTCINVNDPLKYDWWKTTIKDVVKNGIDVVVEDINADGSFSGDELITAVTANWSDILLNRENFEHIIFDTYEAKSNKVFGKAELQEELDNINQKLEDLRYEKKQTEYEIERRKEKGRGEKAVEKHKQKVDKKIKNANAEKVKIEDKIETKGMIDVLVDDIIQIASDTLNLAQSSVGIGDVADNEVFYAYCANYMVHAMEAAEVRRDSLDEGIYHRMIDHSYIDIAEISELKAFVNRVYGVYEQDMIGHSAYTTLAAGWHYADSGEKLKDWLEAKEELKATTKKNLGGWNWLSYATGLQAIYEITAYTGGISQSEYLEAVNKKHKEVWKAGSWNGYNFNEVYVMKGFLPVDRSESVYEWIGEFADKVELPDTFKSIK